MENSLICTRRLFDLIKLPYTTLFLKKKWLTHPAAGELDAISIPLSRRIQGESRRASDRS